MSPASRIPSAISLGVLRRDAPSTSAIMRSRKLSPGSCVISTTMRSESTLVPPVTALRSPPDSRMTGADSPVTADSSTEAMPSMTVPSPGMNSPASTTTTSPRVSSEAGLLGPVAQARDRLRAHGAQGRRLGLAATLGERLGEVGEDHGQPQPDRHREGEPGRLVAASQRLAAEHLDQPSARGDHGADLDHEHDRVAHLHARVELDQAASSAWRSTAPPNSPCGLPRHREPPSVVEREVELEHVHSGLARVRPRPAVVCVLVDQLEHAVQVEPAHLGDASGLDPALPSEMCGSTPDAVVCTASGGTSPFVRPGLYGRSRFRYAARFSSNSAFRSFEFGPRLLKKVAAGLYPVTEGATGSSAASAPGCAACPCRSVP